MANAAEGEILYYRLVPGIDDLAAVVVREWFETYNPEREPSRIPHSIADDVPATSVAESLGRDADVAFSGVVELEGERWTFAVVNGAACLARLTREAALETRFLGALMGGDYTELRTDDSQTLRFAHPRLGQLEITGGHSQRLRPLREAFRAWAEMRPPGQ